MKLSDIKGLWFLCAVAAGYGVLFLLDPATAGRAVGKSGTILWNLLPIFLLVIVVTAAVNYFLKPGQFVKHFEKGNGKRGWLLAIVSGVLSHGPMYAWYPMLQEMREKGVRDGFIVAFLYARSIKLPLLPLMIDYFGWIFTIVLSLYILLGSLIQGVIAERIGAKNP